MSEQPDTRFEPIDQWWPPYAPDRQPGDSVDNTLWASALLGEHSTESREIGHGAWTHTFTPTRAFEGLDTLTHDTAKNDGTVSLETLNALIDKIRTQVAREDPAYFMISTETHKRIRHWERVGHLWRAHPLPDYAIRKCIRRKIIRARQAGMRRIRKMEAREAQRDAELLSKVEKAEIMI